MKPKTFDCVEMKQRGAEKVQEEIARMTPEEEIAFWQNGTEELRQKQQKLRAIAKADVMPLPGQETPRRSGARRSPPGPQ
jgi:hypothetical protein